MADRWRIAIHESAHIIAGRLLRLGCGGARIEPDACADVPVECDVRGVIVLMAGAVAEQLILGAFDGDGVADDCQRWAGLIADAAPVDPDYDEGLWWHYTVAMLSPHVGLIERLAAALFRARFLDGCEIDAVLAQ